MNKADREDNEDVETVKTRSKTCNQDFSNQRIVNQPVPNNEVQVDYARREEVMTEGVIGAKPYPAPY